MKVTVKDTVSFPKFTFQEDLTYIADRIFIPIMQHNIESQISIEGDPLPVNKEATLKRKARLGQGNKSLLATRELIESFYSKTQGRSTVILSLTPIRKKIGGYVQEKGYMFFGINKQMENNAIAYMKTKIKEAIRNATRKPG